MQGNDIISTNEADALTNLGKKLVDSGELSKERLDMVTFLLGVGKVAEAQELINEYIEDQKRRGADNLLTIIDEARNIDDIAKEQGLITEDDLVQELTRIETNERIQGVPQSPSGFVPNRAEKRAAARKNRRK